MAVFVALGADGRARGVLHHPGLSAATVAEGLARLCWQVIPFGPATTPEDVVAWVEEAVLAAGRIQEDVARDAVVVAGGFRALLARKGW